MEVEKRVVEKVGDVIASIEVANHVDEIIIALYSLAARLFPIHPHTILGTIDQIYHHQLSNLVVTTSEERSEWFNVFYKGSGFQTFSRLLLYDVACNWLACFPTCATKCVYDVFFLNGNATEVLEVLVPCLHLKCVAGGYDLNTVTANAERLIVLCLLENDTVLEMAREFMVLDDISYEKLKQNITRTAQLITSIPDKARRGAPISLSPSFFFKRITTYLLRIAEEYDLELVGKSAVAKESHLRGLVLFVSEIFARICRRGSTDVLLSEVIPRILEHVRDVLVSSSDLPISNMFESKSYFRFWSSIIEAVNDSHSVERIAEVLLNQLAEENVSDLESYWTLWILFGQICERRTSARFIFVEKFLLWKVFPVRCLRWILHFAVLECSPDNLSEKHLYSTNSLLETVHRLVLLWSNKEFVQSSSTERQTYLTAALGLCLEKMTKEDLNVTKGVLPSILQGVSCRLESPVYLIRKMASCIALVFSKVIDPENPLYLDDSCEEDSIDWEFGLPNPSSRGDTRPLCLDHKPDEMENSTRIDETHKRSNGVGKTLKSEVNISLLDPDEVIDPATLIVDFGGDDTDVASEGSGISIDSSLEPYDLVDDDTDLKRKFSQLVDVVGALRKSDDAEGVESALDVAEALIRALPDELKYIASELAKILVQVRCSESIMEGEEDSAEDKRQKALVALVVACPVETLDSLNKLIYSANLDISQRIMILDVMTESAQELACTKLIKKPEKYQKPLITSTSDQPWFVPRNTGPSGAGSWKEISSSGNPLNWSYSYERELPSREGMVKQGKTRRWSNRIKGNEMEWSQNNFPPYVAAFMLPFMREFDKKRHGVDLLGRDFIVLGKLIYMLGVCMKCAAMHPEASVLATPLLDMLRSREICHHKEAYVRRSVLFAASCVLVALHPSYVASAVVEGNVEVSQGLDWVRAWALQVAESDTDRECHSLAVACLQLHAEMALQASRAMESASERPISATKTISLFPSVSNRSSSKISFLDS